MENLLANFNDLTAVQRKALVLLLKRRGIDVFNQLPITGVKRDNPLPLSYGQQRLWFLAQLEPDSGAYSIADAVLMNGEVDSEALQCTVNKLVARHESLRTTFQEIDGKPVQCIHENMAVPVQWIDLSGETGETLALAKMRVEAIEQQSFDLENGPLLRISIIKLATGRHVLSVAMHHIVSDEWSLNIIIGEFATIYEAYRKGKEPQLPGLAIGYADYAVWQRNWLEAGEMARQLAYWRERLGSEQTVLELPLDRPRPVAATDRGAKLEFILPENLPGALRELCREEGATLFMALLALFQMLLYRYSGQTTIRLGVPIANRNRRETENLVGFFVNTQVLQTALHGGMSFRQVLAQVKETALGAQAHPDLPFDQLVEALRPERSLNRNPLFQVMYNHQHQQTGTVNALASMQITPFARDTHNTQFELILDTQESVDGGITAILTYALDVFDVATIARLAKHFCRLSQTALKAPDKPLRELEMLGNEENRQQPVFDFTYNHLAIHEAISLQAQATPQAVALIAGDSELRYQELETRSNQLAQHLLGNGVKPGSIVGLCLYRSPELIIATLAILKCGAAYLPLDPDYPGQRLAYMLQDAGVAQVVTQQSLRERLPDIHCICLDSEDWAGASYLPPAITIDPRQTAYLIYTSGSTGQPKGVAVSHGALAMHCRAVAELYGMQPDDRCLHFASFSFDAAVEQWAVPLSNGAGLVMSGQELWSVEQTLAAIARHGISRIDLPPAYLTELARQITPEYDLSALRSCTVGGEALPRDSLALIQSELRPQRLLNAYGPTETVITPLVWQAEANCDSAYAPIGQTIGDRTAHILDADLNLLPAGVAGELYIGGSGLAQGYWQQPGLSAERFLPDPFSAGPGARLYRTGDRVRRRVDGVIEYLGRLDQQIKIRGYRIELGEIEAQLLAQAGVFEAAVMVRDGSTGPQLLAYAAVNDSQLTAEILLAGLKTRLPDNMLPAQIIVLRQLPKLPSGKLDRQALPEPERVARKTTEPRNDTERQLATIWQEVLGLEQVGVEDNFFELGGDSIISLQVVSRARRSGWALTPKDLFRHQTVAALARVAAELKEPADSVVSAELQASGELPLTPVQIEFFETPVSERQHWNQSVLLESFQPLDTAGLKTALRYLVGHHDALRLRFRLETEWLQYYAGTEAAEAQDFLWLRQAADSDEVTAIAQQGQRSLDLQNGPLLRAIYIEVADGSYRLLLVVHHLVIDGVSWRILLEDLQNLYRQISNRQTLQLPAKTATFKAWAQALRRQARIVDDQREYWLQQAGGCCDLPRDFAADNGCTANAEAVTIQLDTVSTRRLLQNAPSAYRTRIDELLLTALARVLCRWRGNPAVTVELEGHGREPLNEVLDISRTLGWFTSVYPVTLMPAADLPASIKAIKEQLRRIPDRGLGYGLLRYMGDEETEAELKKRPKPKVCFNYLGQFDASFAETALFKAAGETRGDEQTADAPLSYWLDINGQVYDGQLAITWSYSSTQYRAGTIEQWAEEFNKELSDLIEHCSKGALGVTPSDFPLAGLNQAQLDNLPLTVSGIKDIYPLTPMQQGLLFHCLYEADAGTYVTLFDVGIKGLDKHRFTSAWQFVLERYDVLRTGFITQGEWPQPLQVVYKQVGLPLQEYDWRSQASIAERLDSLCQALQAEGFQLDNPPLFKLVLVQLTDNDYHLIWLSHHLLLDGWSSARLLGDVLQYYRGVMPAAPLGEFRDYIAWLQARDPLAGESYWREQLASLEAPTRLADALTLKDAKTGHGLLKVQVDGAAADAIRVFLQTHKLTSNTLIQAVWSLLLQRYTGSEAVVFGVTVSGRPAELAGAEDMVGLFINTLPMIQSPHSESKVDDWLQNLQQDNLGLREFDTTPLADIQRWWGSSGEALFDSLLVFENYPVTTALQQHQGDGLIFGPGKHQETTNYPLTLVVQGGDVLQIAFDYDQQHFDTAAVAGLAEHFQLLIGRIVEYAERRIGEIQCLTAAEQAQLASWNRWSNRYEEYTPVHELIRRRAERSPEATAVICGAASLSYGALEHQANRLAHRLLALGIQPERTVAMLLPRSLDSIVAMLAVLKAGGAYLPLDPDSPAERLAELLQDAGVGLMISLSTLDSAGKLSARVHPEPALQPNGAPCVAYDGQANRGALASTPWLYLDQEDLGQQPVTVPEVVLHPGHLAYLIYTSGSTGRPKSVAVAHGALSRHIQAAGELYCFTASDRALHFAAFSFDAAAEQWLAPLCHGAGIVLGGNDWTGEHTAAAVSAHDITIIYPPTSHLLHLADALAAQNRTLALRICCVGGEAVARDSLLKIQRILQPQQLINGYGPTETVITPLAWVADKVNATLSGYAPIGTALGERTLYILDKDLNLLPLGVVGELYIGGPCLARGYYGRPDLTAERFLPDPFAGDGSRLYRTGDLVRCQDDGTLAYIGRSDQQIKLRGYRIEPGEIEAALRQLDGVDDAHVMLRDDHGRRYLAAYLASAAPGPGNPAGSNTAADRFSPARIQTALGRRLPDYMVPAKVVVLERLPRTAHGKIDRRALPAPDFSDTQTHCAPTTAKEQILVQLWQDLLGRAPIGIRDNFFELGGDSIISIQMVSRARSQGLLFSPKDLFQHQSIESLAHVAVHADGQDHHQAGVNDQAPVTGTAALLPIQCEFFAQALANPAHWNQSLLLKARQPLNTETLQQALHQLLAHHDSLRLRYHRGDHGWTQTYAELSAAFADPAHSAVLDQQSAADAAGIEAIARAAQRSLDLEHGPLLKAVHIQVADGSERLLLIAHHLVVDGVSWRILLEDLQSAYQHCQQGQTRQLPVTTASLQSWAQALQHYALSPALQAQLSYWQQQSPNLQESTTTLPWPCDNLHGRAETRDRVSRTLTLDTARTRALLHDANGAYRTRIQELLLAALARTLCDWTGSSDISIELEGHGRETEAIDGQAGAPHLDLSRSIGWFTSLYPVKLTTSADLGDTIKTVKEQLRQIPDHGLGYGVLKHLAAPDQRKQIQALPKPKITFNYLGQFDASFDAQALLQPADEDSGDERDLHAPLGNELEINGQIYQGQLSLSWSYSRERYHQTSIDRLIEHYQQQLHAIIEHCQSANPSLTPSDVALAGLNQAQLDALPVNHAHIEDLYPLSPMQQGILFHALREPEANLYVTQLAADMEGLDAERFCAAWQKVLRRHEVLRTGFFWQGELVCPLQAVFREPELPLELLDWRDRIVSAAELSALQEADYARGFDLNKAPLLRLTLVNLANQRTHLIWTSHHLLLDGWSTSLLLGEVMEIYAGSQVARSNYGRFRDYIAWLQRQDRRAGEVFWRDQLNNLDGPCLLTSAVSVPAAISGNGYLSCRLNEIDTQALQVFTQNQRITLNTLLQGAWALLLRHYTGQTTVVFGATVAGRPSELPGVESLLGLFINTLPVVTAISLQVPLDEWLRALQANNLKMREYEYVPLYDIQRWAGWAGLGGDALFDTLLVFENYPVDEALKMQNPGLSFSNIEQNDVTNYPLTLDIAVGATLEIGFDFALSQFDEADIQLISSCLMNLLMRMVQQPKQAIGYLEYGEDKTVQSAVATYPSFADIAIHDAISLQAQATPQAVALIAEDHELRYQELETRSNQLAHRLLGYGVKPGNIVGLCLYRSHELIIATLAILKCGAAYLPLDPYYPSQRLAYILQDAGVALVLTQQNLRERLPESHCFCLDSEDWAGASYLPPAITIDPQQTAYLIYTSGSTGQPKGVAVSHGALAMHCRAVAELYGMQPDDRCLHFASFSFDAAVEQWAVPLSNGAGLVMSSQALWSVEQTLEAIHRHGITRIDLPPAYLTELARQAGNNADTPLLRSCTVGGEALPRDSLALIQSELRPQRLLNAYGPTETVITPLVWQAEANCDSAYAPIGQTIGDRTAHILDADLNLLPAGVAGELYIGGSGLAQGYWQQPGLSAERFLPDPFSAGPGARLYRTGDRVRRRVDGVIEYLGRLDQQIKIRGYRIELGEIEAQLLAQAGVFEAAVMVRDGSTGPQLLAYAAVNDSQLTAEILLAGLKTRLPDNMLPAQIIVLRQLPKLPSGKLDRQALPEPERVARKTTEPRNDTERQLAAIWQEVLGLEQVGVEDNFFELGGHSLTALRLVSLTNQRLNWNLPLSRLLQHPTIAALAQESPIDPLSPLVALNRSEGKQLPLFCMHPAGGTVFGYYPLARALAGQRPVFGVLCRSFLDPNWRDISLQAMAADYARAVMQQQPEGPIHLLGWSLGGALALSMTQQLEQAGREVAFLGLVDSFVPGFDADGSEDEADDNESLRALLNHLAPGLALSAATTEEPSSLKLLANDSTDNPSEELLKLLDVTTGLAIMERLSSLSESYRIEPIQAALHCWWSDAAGEAAGFAQDMLEEASGSRVKLSARIPASHSVIVRHADFIADVIDILNKYDCGAL